MIKPLDNGRYDTVAAFVQAATTECVNPANQDCRDRFSGDAESHGAWYGAGCNTGKDVQQKLATGWKEGRVRVQELMGQIDTSKLVPKDMRRRLTRGDHGDHLDIHAVYAGRIDIAWTRATRQTSVGQQRIDVLANMVCSGGEDSEVLFWRGAAAVAFADKMESAGYMVRLIVGFGDGRQKNDKWEGSVSCRVVVKDHDKPLNITTTASVIMPGFFRGIGHGWIAAHDTELRYSPGIFPLECRQEKREIYLSHQVRDKKTALAWLQAQIDAINAKG